MLSIILPHQLRPISHREKQTAVYGIVVQSKFIMTTKKQENANILFVMYQELDRLWEKDGVLMNLYKRIPQLTYFKSIAISQLHAWYWFTSRTALEKIGNIQMKFRFVMDLQIPNLNLSSYFMILIYRAMKL